MTPRRGPKQHLVMQEYKGQDGQWRHREICPTCKSKKKVKVERRIRDNKTIEVDEQCPECTGHGFLWKLGRAYPE